MEVDGSKEKIYLGSIHFCDIIHYPQAGFYILFGGKITSFHEAHAASDYPRVPPTSKPPIAVDSRRRSIRLCVPATALPSAFPSVD